jgi:hypothetical protein
MSARDDNHATCDGRKQAEPICSAIDHDAGIIVPQGQRTDADGVWNES